MSYNNDDDKPCKACSDFKSWAKQHKKNFSKDKESEQPSNNQKSSPEPSKHTECPLDKEELGRSTWSYLHSMAAYYPDTPTKSQSKKMTKYFCIFSKFYPCEPCALDFQADIKANPPQTNSRDELAKWLCERHNTVNKKIGKPLFDCSKIHERWRDGWADGSCD